LEEQSIQNVKEENSSQGYWEQQSGFTCTSYFTSLFDVLQRVSLPLQFLCCLITAWAAV